MLPGWPRLDALNANHDKPPRYSVNNHHIGQLCGFYVSTGHGLICSALSDANNPESHSSARRRVTIARMHIRCNLRYRRSIAVYIVTSIAGGRTWKIINIIPSYDLRHACSTVLG